LAEAPSFLTTDWILAQFSERRSEAQRRYQRFVAEGRRASPWEELKGQIYLGSEEFIERLPKPAETMEEIPQIQREGVRPPLAQIFAKASVDEAIATAYREYGYTMKAIADYLGVHYATVSRRLRRQELLDRKT
jgi:DNA-directed RNA polymerase specialized sigma24 family protein